MKTSNTTTPKPYRLTFEDTVNVWLCTWQGQFQHHIAATYGVNPGRVNDVLKERVHFDSKAAAEAIRKAA